MAHPQVGDTVSVHYTGRLIDGQIFASSREEGPLELTVGERQAVAGFEEALTQMKPGEQKTITVGPDRAYGPRRPELVLTVDRDRLPRTITPAIGQEVHVQRRDGSVTPARIAEVSDNRVTIDANHPLAGETLTFELELVAIRGQPS